MGIYEGCTKEYLEERLRLDIVRKNSYRICNWLENIDEVEKILGRSIIEELEVAIMNTKNTLQIYEFLFLAAEFKVKGFNLKLFEDYIKSTKNPKLMLFCIEFVDGINIPEMVEALYAEKNPMYIEMLTEGEVQGKTGIEKNDPRYLQVLKEAKSNTYFPESLKEFVDEDTRIDTSKTFEELHRNIKKLTKRVVEENDPFLAIELANYYEYLFEHTTLKEYKNLCKGIPELKDLDLVLLKYGDPMEVYEYLESTPSTDGRIPLMRKLFQMGDKKYINYTLEYVENLSDEERRVLTGNEVIKPAQMIIKFGRKIIKHVKNIGERFFPRRYSIDSLITRIDEDTGDILIYEADTSIDESKIVSITKLAYHSKKDLTPARLVNIENEEDVILDTREYQFYKINYRPDSFRRSLRCILGEEFPEGTTFTKEELLEYKKELVKHIHDPRYINALIISYKPSYTGIRLFEGEKIVYANHVLSSDLINNPFRNAYFENGKEVNPLEIDPGFFYKVIQVNEDGFFDTVETDYKGVFNIGTRGLANSTVSEKYYIEPICPDDMIYKISNGGTKKLYDTRYTKFALDKIIKHYERIKEELFDINKIHVRINEKTGKIDFYAINEEKTQSEMQTPIKIVNIENKDDNAIILKKRGMGAMVYEPKEGYEEYADGYWIPLRNLLFSCWGVKDSQTEDLISIKYTRQQLVDMKNLIYRTINNPGNKKYNDLYCIKSPRGLNNVADFKGPMFVYSEIEGNGDVKGAKSPKKVTNVYDFNTGDKVASLETKPYGNIFEDTEQMFDIEELCPAGLVSGYRGKRYYLQSGLKQIISRYKAKHPELFGKRTNHAVQTKKEFCPKATTPKIPGSKAGISEHTNDQLQSRSGSEFPDGQEN